MQRRHLPRLWLMTDERMGEDLWPALDRLPRGSGIVFRHHATPLAERRRIFARIVRVARRRSLTVVRAGRTPMRGEMGAHNARVGARGLATAAVHDPRDAVRAVQRGARLVFVSPVFSTRSHPSRAGIGPIRLGLLLQRLPVGLPAIALGGIDSARFRRLKGLGLWGWAAIDAWLPNGRG